MKKRVSLSLKILVAYSILILIFATSTFFWTINLFKESGYSSTKEKLKTQAYLIREIIKTDLFTDKLEQKIISLYRKTNSRITIIRNDGMVMADSEKNHKEMENHLMRPEIQDALKNGSGSAIRYSTTIKNEMLYFALSIPDSNGLVAFARVSLKQNYIDKLSQDFLYSLIQSMFWVIFFSIVISILLAKSILGPIKKLVHFAHRLPKEEFKTRSNIMRHDEIGDLAQSFNLMAGEIEHLFTKIDSEKQELNSIINSLNEGLIVLDYNLKVRLVNQSFKKSFAEKAHPNQNISKFISSVKLLDCFREARYKGSTFSHDFEYRNRYYYISCKNLPLKKTIIYIFHDISERKLLEIQKKEFISNVSHELRTPLTSIKGFVETLIDDEKNEEKRHFLDIIHRNSERLILMISDLLSLSSLESSQYELNKEYINLVKLIEQVIIIFNDQLDQKGLKLSFVHTEKIIEAYLDPYRFEQVLINLIDNAIKYSDSGNIKIECGFLINKIFLNIADTGIGISKEDQSRIFERFFVINKSRSRQFGGTGLGLSLVKHIILLHSGNIQIKSNLGKGTTFKITLPKQAN